MKSSCLITNARLVNEGRVFDSDLLIRNGRIEAIGADLASRATDQVVDACGRYLLPGIIDDQVHFREPGATHKGEIATESRAAIAGGVTSYLEMPNCNPTTTHAAALQAKLDRAAQVSAANYGFYLGATNKNLEDIRRVDIHKACGIKIFMGASTGDMLVDDVEVLAGIFKESPLLVATHCEDTPTILLAEEQARQKWGEKVPYAEHANIRSEEACYRSSSLAVELAKRYGTQLHVLHLTTARELELFSPGEMSGKKITAEVCCHHLSFSAADYATLGAKLKCNPSVKTEADRQALLLALKEGRIDILATDHAPHTLEEKGRDYFQAPSGLPLVQHHLQALMELVKEKYIDLQTLVQKACHNPAELFSIKERGYLREGYHADLVLLSAEGDFPVEKDPISSKCGWTPFAGRRFSRRVDAVYLAGQLAYDHAGCKDGLRGQALEYQR